MSEQLDRNLALDLVRVTEGAALAAARWMGRGDKNNADAAAVNAMRLLLGQINIDGMVVIGEGEKDEAPMLFNGERIGRGVQDTDECKPAQLVDIAVDPVDGTRLLSLGLPNALAVIAIADRGAMFSPGHVVYMDKLAVGPAGRGVIHIEASVADNLHALARAKGTDDVGDLTAVILDRPRNQKFVDAVRACGARLKLVSDGDVAAAISTALDGTGVDILFGIGGSPEGVIAAAALKCLGGDMQAKLWPRDDREREYAQQDGHDINQVLTLDDLVRGENVFFSATGITDGEMLRGVHYSNAGATSESLVMRARSGTVRRIASTHRLEKLMRYSQIEFGA